MKRHIISQVIGCICLIGLCINLQAFDGQRKGFILGVGLGPGLTTYKFEQSSDNFRFESDRKSKFGIQSDFKIGYAPSNTLEILYTNKVSWFSIDTGSEKFGGPESITITNGISSVAITHFFQPAAPSPYLTVGIGIAVWSAPFEVDLEGISGFGLFLGGGMEFSPHWDVGATVMWGKPGNSESGFEEHVNALTFQLTINVKAY